MCVGNLGTLSLGFMGELWDFCIQVTDLVFLFLVFSLTSHCPCLARIRDA